MRQPFLLVGESEGVIKGFKSGVATFLGNSGVPELQVPAVVFGAYVELLAFDDSFLGDEFSSVFGALVAGWPMVFGCGLFPMAFD